MDGYFNKAEQFSSGTQPLNGRGGPVIKINDGSVIPEEVMVAIAAAIKAFEGEEELTAAVSAAVLYHQEGESIPEEAVTDVKPEVEAEAPGNTVVKAGEGTRKKAAKPWVTMARYESHKRL